MDRPKTKILLTLYYLVPIGGDEESFVVLDGVSSKFLYIYFNLSKKYISKNFFRLEEEENQQPGEEAKANDEQPQPHGRRAKRSVQ